jgi:hypothetical protein
MDNSGVIWWDIVLDQFNSNIAVAPPLMHRLALENAFSYNSAMVLFQQRVNALEEGPVKQAYMSWITVASYGGILCWTSLTAILLWRHL